MQYADKGICVRTSKAAVGRELGLRTCHGIIRKYGMATHIPADGRAASGATEYSRDHEVHVQYLDYYKEMYIEPD